MQSSASDLAVMFVRICDAGNAKLPGTLDDTAIRARVLSYLDELIACAREQGGTLIKTLGDEIIFTFSDVVQAATAACHIQEWIDSAGALVTSDGLIRLAGRIGMHFGPVLHENGDIFGDTVNVAARMLAIAKPRQIITTTPTRQMMSPIFRANTRLIDHTPIKGKKDTIDIYEVLWLHDDLTHVSTGAALATTRGRELRVFLAERHFRINSEHPALVLGRSRAADITLRESLASRQHARIEYRRGNFFIVDQSTNGTYLEHNGKVTFLRRESVLLSGTGRISLGRPFTEEPREVLRYDAMD